MTLLGKEGWKLCPWNCPGFCHVSLEDFNLYPFAEINHNNECNSFG